MSSNVVQLFKPEPRSIDKAMDITSAILDLAENRGIDISHPSFRIQCNLLVTMVQATFNDAEKL